MFSRDRTSGFSAGLFRTERAGGSDMKARPRTKASLKRIMRRKAKRRAGNKPSLGIPPSCMVGGPRK
jgi:hypothetical protein